MAVKFTAIGWTRWLELFVRQGATAHLFESGTVGSFVEPTSNGYKPFALIGARWELSARGAIVSASYPELLWRFTAPLVPLGYFIANKDGEVLWWEPFEGPPAGPVDLQALRLVIELDAGEA